MDNQSKLTVFQSQTINVRAIRTSMRQVHRSINSGLRTNDTVSAETFTKIYALLFCGWAEANFIKVLYTPYGFDIGEIEQIKAEKDRNGIQKAWKKCVHLGLRRLSAQRGSFRPNAQQKFERLIEAYVVEPTQLRNKMAHGQWAVALNREFTALNEDLTRQIGQLNVVRIDGWVQTHALLAAAVECLIESPKKTFIRDWFVFVEDLERNMVAAETRTLTEHVLKLRSKDAASGAHAKRGRR